MRFTEIIQTSATHLFSGITLSMDAATNHKLKVEKHKKLASMNQKIILTVARRWGIAQMD